VIEEKSFRIDEHAGVDRVADELDKALDAGWRYVSHFPVGRGLIVVMVREKPPEPEPVNGKAKAKAKVTA